MPRTRGLAPGYRESAGKRKELGITKQGSGLLRWALVESGLASGDTFPALRARCSRRWLSVAREEACHHRGGPSVAVCDGVECSRAVAGIRQAMV